MFYSSFQPTRDLTQSMLLPITRTYKKLWFQFFLVHGFNLSFLDLQKKNYDVSLFTRLYRLRTPVILLTR